MTTKIYLVRHAEAEGNLFRVAHGQYNSTITPQGYRQLAFLRRRFRDIHLDAVYGSDLIRAQTTASALYISHGLTFRPMPLLREVCLGVWEQMTWAEIQRADREMYTNFNNRPHLWRVEGGETFSQVRARTLDGIRQIARENPGKVVAATSHGAALRTLLAALQGFSLEEMGRTPHGDNTAVSLLEVEDETIRVVYRDDVSHLPAEYSTFSNQSWHKSDAATEPGLWFRRYNQGQEAVAEGMLEETAVGRIAYRLEPDALRVTEYQLSPDFRGRRFGVQLLGQAVRYAREQGKERLVMDCPPDLTGYFKKYGFEDTAQGFSMDLRLIIRAIPEV